MNPRLGHHGIRGHVARRDGHGRKYLAVERDSALEPAGGETAEEPVVVSRSAPEPIARAVECAAGEDYHVHLVGVNGWGIWDALGGGNLLAFGPILDGGGNPIVDKTFTSGNQPRFIDQELKVGLD